MYTCNNGRLQTVMKGGKEYYRLRLFLVDDSVKGNHKYKDKYITTDLLVGGKTGRMKNENLAQEMLTQAIREYTPFGANMKFSEYCKYWHQEKLKGHEIRKITSEGYDYKIGKIVGYFSDNDISLGEITTSDLNEFKDSLYKIRKASTAQRKEVGLSDRTIRDILIRTKQIFKFAIENGHIVGHNPSASVKLPPKSNHDDDLPFIGEEDIVEFQRELETQCSDHPFLIYAYQIALFYGLRREEL